MDLNDPTKYPEFTATNESLYAIMTGLNVNETDKILTIGGSGDQAFAFLETAKRVGVVDMDQRSIKRIVSRTIALRKGKKPIFLDENSFSPYVAERNSYFTEDRMKKIKANLDNLSLLGIGDVVEYAKNGGFNKIYCSNAVGYYLHWGDNKISAALKILETYLPKEGLVYISRMQNTILLEPRWNDLIPRGLLIDNILTSQAGELENNSMFKPMILRKI